MVRDIGATLRLVEQGTALCDTAIRSFAEHDFDAPALPGWTRRHLVAHLAANGEAIGRLLQWARTGVPTPMYATPEQRAADIEAGSRLAGAELVRWFDRSSSALAHAFAAMTDADWRAEVVTAQGRTVQAAETTWMRSREVLVHAVDLGAGTTFADLPAAFLAELRDEILAKRAAEQLPVLVGDLASVAAHLAGRPAGTVTTPDGGAAPRLGPWL